MKSNPTIKIEHSTRIERPIEEVFAFFDSPENLLRAMPPSTGIELQHHPNDLRPGSTLAYRLRRWPVELRWEELVSEYRPPFRLVSVQSRGQFVKWTQEQDFVSEGSSTRVSVRLQYQMRRGWIGSVADRLRVRSALEHLVSGRLEKARQRLEQESVTTP